jgi:hypothetical protein
LAQRNQPCAGLPRTIHGLLSGAAKVELEIWGGALLARIESGEQRMLTELARHTRAIQEAMATSISVIEEKYADLSTRVSGSRPRCSYPSSVDRQAARRDHLRGGSAVGDLSIPSDLVCAQAFWIRWHPTCRARALKPTP